MATVELSEAALALLRLHFSGRSLMVGACNPESLPGHTVDETRAAFGEYNAIGTQTRAPGPITLAAFGLNLVIMAELEASVRTVCVESTAQ